MARPKPKKKRRSRSDPSRREAAARRDEARRLAADERRKEQEAADRRKRLKKTARRFAVPVVVGVGVVLAAIFLFRPKPELPGVEKVNTASILAGLGKVVPGDIESNRDLLDQLPAAVCGVVEDPSAEQLYSDLRNGAVVLFHAPGDASTAAALAELAGRYESQVVVAPSDRLDRAVLAVSWGRRKGFDSAADPGVAGFADTYRFRVRAREACPVPGG